jgi:hypothetical protein
MLRAKELQGMTSRERAIARAKDEDLRVIRQKTETPYDYKVQSSTEPEKFSTM